MALIYAQARYGAMPWADAERAGSLLVLIASLVTVETGVENNPMEGAK